MGDKTYFALAVLFNYWPVWAVAFITFVVML